MSLVVTKKRLPLHSLFEKNENATRYFRAFSSAGSEHLPYKQRVGGSNPSTPTKVASRIAERQSISEHEEYGSLAQLNRAFDYGSKGYRFESYASHTRKRCKEIHPKH